MKTIFCGGLILFATLIAVRADQFHLSRAKGGGNVDVSYATVKITQGDKTTFEGRTDKYGHITIGLPNGNYQAVVIQGPQKSKASLTIDGQKKLKEVVVP